VSGFGENKYEADPFSLIAAALEGECGPRACECSEQRYYCGKKVFQLRHDDIFVMPNEGVEKVSSCLHSAVNQTGYQVS